MENPRKHQIITPHKPLSLVTNLVQCLKEAFIEIPLLLYFYSYIDYFFFIVSFSQCRFFKIIV